MPKRDEALAAFGRNVAKFRTKRGFSQDKLAEEASLDRTYLSGIERGVRNPGIKVVIPLARGLSVSIDSAKRLLFPVETYFYINPQAGKVCAVKVPGDINRNDQQLLRRTEEPGTDHNARVWVLKCRQCLNIYGSNSTDAWERKCPTCQKGKAGLTVPTERDGQDWTREEHIIAFQLYNKIEFGTIHMGNPEIIELAALLGRTVGSASLKLANFSRLDPFLQRRNIKGLPHGAKGEEAVWLEFAKDPEGLAFESERLLAEREGRSVEEVTQIETDDLPPPGKEREAIVRVRVNQRFFRRRVLSAYGFCCCVTGLSNRSLLVASHIVPWAEDPINRLNPRNGLCLNALHDRAFDSHLMWIEPDFVIRLSPNLRRVTAESRHTVEWLLSFDGKQLILPKRFQPDCEFLANHALSALRTSSSFKTLP